MARCRVAELHADGLFRTWILTVRDADGNPYTRVLAMYERYIRPSVSDYPPMNVLTDGASLLWRLSLAGRTDLDDVGGAFLRGVDTPNEIQVLTSFIPS